jgi:F420-0:gamma-glutamyl ligase-like protein
MSPSLKTRPFRTAYWEPGSDYVATIIQAIRPHLKNGDFIVVSEKAVSTARGLLIDEAKASPSLSARAIARLWLPLIWGYLLGPLCRFKPPTIRRLRAYPAREGAAHKQVAISYAGPLHALKYGSEGGIDLSNLPLCYAALPLKDSQKVAEFIQRRVVEETGKRSSVMIVDTDSTFSLRNIHFTSRPNPLSGIHYFPGPLFFIFGRALMLRQRATPLALAGAKLDLDEALNIAERSHHARGYGAGRTVWDVATNTQTGIAEVTWELLREIKHYPLVIARPD